MRQASDSNSDHRVALAALLASALLVAAVTFVLSFHGLSDYGFRVAGFGSLSPLVPVGADGMALVAVAATFLLRHARLRVRLYAWSVFAVAVASSVAGNLSHAASRHLATEGMIGAAVWPVFLAMASHLVIVVRRELDRHRPAPVERVVATANSIEDAPVAASDSTPADADPREWEITILPLAATATDADNNGAHEEVAAVASDIPPATPVAATAPKRPRRTTPRNTNCDKARKRVAAGDSCATVALALGVEKRTVERWTQDIRQARQSAASSKGATA
jgi:hypothetical protein